MEIEIHDELSSSDSLKQISGLSKLNQYWINAGRDPTLFFASILKVISETDNKTTRILSYNILKNCKQCSQTEWASLIHYLVKDLNSDDSEVVISILKTLPHISTILTELLMVGNADFGPLVRHQNQSVRRTALDTLMSLLFYRKVMLQNYKSFVSTGWELIVDRVLEEPQPSVYQSAFNAISTLFSEISRSVSHADEFDNSVQRRQTLSFYGDWVCTRLVDHFDLLLSRAEHIDINHRHVAVNTLTYLADTISRAAGVPYWPSSEVPKLSQKHKHLSSPQNVVSILVDHFLALLGSSNDSLVFAVGKAILDLLLTQQNQHNESWINPVLTAFIGLLRREGVTLNPLPILLAIMGVLPMLNDDLLFCTLTKIFPSIKTITDSNQRVSYLIRTFELIIDRHVTSNGKSSLFTPLMVDQYLISTFQDESSSFREEIVISMVASHHNILTKYLSQEEILNSTSVPPAPTQQQSGSTPISLSSSTSFSSVSSSSSSSNSSNKLGSATSSVLFYLHQAALNISEVCLKCVLWGGERISAIEYCIRFVDWLCRVTLPHDSPHSTKLIQLLRSDLLDQIPKIPSDYICLQSIFLICSHLLSKSSSSTTNRVYEQSDATLLINILRRRFLFIDNQPKFTQFNGTIRDMVLGVAQYGRATAALLHSLSGFWLGSLECLYLLGLNIPSVETAVQRTLDDLLAIYPNNKSVYNRTRFIRNLLFIPPDTVPSKHGTIRNQSFLPFANPNSIDFSYCIPIEFLDSPNSLRSTSDIFAYECKKAITGIAGVHYGASIRDRSSREVTLLSGSCDPVWVEVYHTIHPTLHTITLHVQITNIIHFTIKNINLVVGIAGHLEFPHPQTLSKFHIAKLLPEKSQTFEIPLVVTGLDHNYVTFNIAFHHPSGVCEIENTAQQKREKGGSSMSLHSSNSSGNVGNVGNGGSGSGTNIGGGNTAVSGSSTSSPQSSSSIIGGGASISSSSTTFSSTTTSSTITATFAQPIEIRCADYIFDWNQFLIPFKYNKHQFLQQWPRFEASFSVDIVFEGNVTPQLIYSCLYNYPFHNVQNCYYSNSNFQFAYSASTWFNDQICFTITGMDKENSNTGGDDNNLSGYSVIHSRFEFRSSNTGVLASFQNVLEHWIHKIPRSNDNFLARKLSPGEESMFSYVTIQETDSPSVTSQIQDEITLLNKWKEQKNMEQTNTLFTLLALDQDFY
eukprot:gene10767-13184_t